MVMKINIEMIENEIQGVMQMQQLDRPAAKYIIYHTLQSEPQNYEFDGQMDLIMGYLSPTRVLH